MRLSYLGLSLLIGLTVPCAVFGQSSKLTAKSTPEGIEVSQGDRPVLFYQRTVKSLDHKWPRAGYIHPLYDLQGEVMTEDFPSDHGHHRGLFWAWHQVSVGDQSLGDAWLCNDFVWDVKSVAARSPSLPLELVATTQWKSPDYVDDRGEMIPVLQERSKITVHATEDDHRVIDFDLSLLALVPELRIGGSDDDKGYGGFSPRIKLTSDQRFLSANGEIQPTVLAIEAGYWVNITTKTRGLVMIAHPSNPPPHGADKPVWWILRRNRSMQNAVYPGRTPVEVSMQNPTRLRYRLVVHDGSITNDEIEQLRDSLAVLSN